MKIAWALIYGYFILAGLAAGLEIYWSPEIEMLFRGGYLFAIVAWFDAYARRHRLALPMDMGMFLYFATAVVVPYYVVRAEGWRKGMRTLAWLLLAVGLSAALSFGLPA